MDTYKINGYMQNEMETYRIKGAIQNDDAYMQMKMATCKMKWRHAEIKMTTYMINGYIYGTYTKQGNTRKNMGTCAKSKVRGQGNIRKENKGIYVKPNFESTPANAY